MDFRLPEILPLPHGSQQSRTPITNTLLPHNPPDHKLPKNSLNKTAEACIFDLGAEGVNVRHWGRMTLLGSAGFGREWEGHRYPAVLPRFPNAIHPHGESETLASLHCGGRGLPFQLEIRLSGHNRLPGHIPLTDRRHRRLASFDRQRRDSGGAS